MEGCCRCTRERDNCGLEESTCIRASVRPSVCLLRSSESRPRFCLGCFDWSLCYYSAVVEQPVSGTSVNEAAAPEPTSIAISCVGTLWVVLWVGISALNDEYTARRCSQAILYGNLAVDSSTA